MTAMTPADPLPAFPASICATGIGSWPGTSAREAVRTVRDLLAEALPYLPELPARGVGADMIGRTGTMLEGLHLETHPYGWRFVDRPGRDEGRAAAYLRQDLDELAEAYDGWTGPLKVQVGGPWTLLASIELSRGERAVSDPGARRDVVGSLAEGVRAHLADVQRLVPGAELVLQVDEPALPAVLDGRLPTQSGYGRLRAVDRGEVRDGLREVLEAAGERATAVHCCAPDAPLPLLREAGAGALAVDLALVTGPGWDAIAEHVETGGQVWAGALPTSGEGGDFRAVVARVTDPWQRLGLDPARLAQVTITPACGLAGLTPSSAVRAQRTIVDAARELADGVD